MIFVLCIFNIVLKKFLKAKLKKRYKNGKKPYYLCDNEIASKLSGRVLNLGSTGKEIASNLYAKLLYL